MRCAIGKQGAEGAPLPLGDAVRRRASSRTARATSSPASYRCPPGLHLWARGVLLWLVLAARLGSQASAQAAPAAATSWVATKDGSLYRALRTQPVAGGTEVITRRGTAILIATEDIARKWPDTDSPTLHPDHVMLTSCPQNRYQSPLSRELTMAGEETTPVQLIAISPGVSIRFQRSSGTKQEQRSWAEIESIVRPKDRPDSCQPIELPAIAATEEAAAARKDKDAAASSALASASGRGAIRVRLEADRPIQLWELVPDRDQRQLAEGLTMDSLILYPDIRYKVTGNEVVGAVFQLEPQRAARIFVQTGQLSPTAGGVVLTVLGSMGMAAGVFTLLPAGMVAVYQASYPVYGHSDFTGWVAGGVVALGLGVVGLTVGIHLINDNKTRVLINDYSGRVEVVAGRTGPGGKWVARLRITERGLEF